jgi:small basic protein
MMMLVPLAALVLGVLAVFLTKMEPLRGVTASYLAVACIAGLDTMCGGYRSGLEQKFRNDVFITGFISNTLIAFFLAWLGDTIGVNLYLVAALVLGQRIFVNLSVIRRILLTRAQDSVARRRQKREQAAQAQATNTQS